MAEHEESAEEEVSIEPGTTGSRCWVLAAVIGILSGWFTGDSVAFAQSGEARRTISCEGPFAPTTTPEILAAAFGAANVAVENIHVGEGQFEEGTVLFPKSADERLEILWTGGITHGRPRHWFVRGEKSLWRTVRGLTLGTSLQAVERLNRRPFRLLGFGWDYAGTTMDWSNGLLDSASDGPCRIRARFLPTPEARDMDSGKWYAQLRGDREFSSGHPAMQVLNPVIYEIFVQYQQ